MGTSLLLALLALAHRSLWWNAPALPTHSQVEGWLFRPVPLPAVLLLAIAGWLVWRRRARFLALPVVAAPIAAAAWLVLGGAIFVWAHLTGAADLLLASLSAQLMGLAAAARGGRGCRVLALPAIVLLLGTRIPAPLQDELVWRLQLGTTSAAARLVEALGHPLAHGGVVLRSADHSFQVIDGCSGLRGIMILTLVAVLVRELFRDAGRRMWLLLPLASVLGFALNVVRVAYVATSPDPEALAGMKGDHTPQGIAVLMTGTAILYFLGWSLARSTSSERPVDGRELRSGTAPDRLPSFALLGCWAGLLAALSLGLSPWRFARETMEKPRIELPERARGWVSEPLVGDPLFFGSGGQLLHRRYVPLGEDGEQQAVEVFVGYETSATPGTSQLLSSKLDWPGPDWDVLRESPATLWVLQRDGDWTLATRRPGGEHAVVYTWRPGDLGWWHESIRSLLALDASPLRRERARMVVRLIAFAPHDGSLALDRARQRLDHFIMEFRDPLAAL